MFTNVSSFTVNLSYTSTLDLMFCVSYLCYLIVFGKLSYRLHNTVCSHFRADNRTEGCSCVMALLWKSGSLVGLPVRLYLLSKFPRGFLPVAWW